MGPRVTLDLSSFLMSSAVDAAIGPSVDLAVDHPPTVRLI